MSCFFAFAVKFGNLVIRAQNNAPPKKVYGNNYSDYEFSVFAHIFMVFLPITFNLKIFFNSRSVSFKLDKILRFL